jgi:uncharacterized membrane protein
MQVKTYKKINQLAMILLALLLLYSLFYGNAFVIFFSVAFYMIFISLLRTRVDGVLTDERQTQVSEKAAQTSFQVFMPIFLLTSLGLLVGGGRQQFYYVKALGVILAYVTLLCLLIYLVTYWYYDRKTGGRFS